MAPTLLALNQAPRNMFTDDEELGDELYGFHLVSHREARGLTACRWLFGETEEGYWDRVLDDDDYCEEDYLNPFDGDGNNSYMDDEMELKSVDLSEPEVTEIYSRRQDVNTYLESSTYRPVKNARTPYIGSRTEKIMRNLGLNGIPVLTHVMVDGRTFKVGRAA